MKRDIGRKSPSFHRPPAFNAPVKGVPIGIYCRNAWCGKVGWCGYETVKKSLKMCLVVSIEYTDVTDRRTDGRTDTARRHRPRLCITSRGKMYLRLSGIRHLAALAVH